MPRWQGTFSKTMYVLHVSAITRGTMQGLFEIAINQGSVKFIDMLLLSSPHHRSALHVPMPGQIAHVRVICGVLWFLAALLAGIN